nr:transposase [Streptomyces sp. CB03578]
MIPPSRTTTRPHEQRRTVSRRPRPHGIPDPSPSDHGSAGAARGAVPTPRPAPPRASPRTAYLLDGLPVEVLGRVRSDSVMRKPMPRPWICPPQNGRPPKHGKEFRFARPESWGEPDAATVPGPGGLEPPGSLAMSGPCAKTVAPWTSPATWLEEQAARHRYEVGKTAKRPESLVERHRT